MHRWRWPILLSAIVAAAGCGPNKPVTGGVPGDSTGGGLGTNLKVAMVTDAGGIDDKSFNASAWAGLQKAAKELGLTTKPRNLASHELTDYETNLTSFGDQGYDLVFAVGYLMEDALKKVAPRYPKTKFAIIDGNAPQLPNCLSVRFREEEGCFLAGFLAEKMSKTGGIGFVGGETGALMTRFEIGYRAGARTARSDARVIVKYVGNWTDLSKGTEFGRILAQQDADVVFAAAGKAGLGTLAAIADKGDGYYGIGVDRDQDDLYPGRILTSVMKGVDVAVYRTTKQVAAGQWKAGEQVLGLKEGGMHLSPMRFTKKDIPPDVLSKLDLLTKAISDGKIAVPKTEDEIQNFVPPKV